MKKHLKLAFITLACTNLLMADMVFNLGAQQFSNSVEGNFKDSTYELDKTIVSTALKFDKGHYISDGSGSFKVELKEPQPKWGVTFDMNSYLYDRGLGVTLLGKEGQVLTLFFSYGEISVDGKVIEDNTFGREETIVGSLESNGAGVTVVINGKHSFKIDKSNFKLAYIEINLGNESHGAQYYPDQLNGLAISTKLD